MSTTLSSLALAERSVPRYTSYPTAPHFSPAVDGATAARWLADLSPAATLSLYLHVPYCSAICTYCGCHTKAVRRVEPLDDYTDALEAEIGLMAAATPARKVRHIHWGGGTPSLLGPVRLKRLADALAARFDLSGMAEHAIELDPRTVDEPLATGLAAMGITRASLGVQDFNPKVQAAIGRIQPYEVVARAVELLRSAGIEALNFDLMYGLPQQSEADVRRSAELAVGLRPGRFAIFGYAHVPWFKVHQKLIDPASLPGAAARIRQAEIAREVLEGAGYQAIGLDHFALPEDDMAQAAREGRLRRNFQGYTTDLADALLPFGVSSIGRLPQGYIANATDQGAWRRAQAAGIPAVMRGIAFTDEDRARASVIERLMCDYAVDYGAIAAAMLGSADALDDALPALAELEMDGLIDTEGRTVRMRPAAQPYVRLVAAAFDAYLRDRQGARHSVAV